MVARAIRRGLPRVRITIRWLMGAVAVAALILGSGVAWLRSQDPHWLIAMVSAGALILWHGVAWPRSKLAT
jgi:hypothetical protein